MLQLRAIWNDLCGADKCLGESLADFVFVFTCSWVKSFGM